MNIHFWILVSEIRQNSRNVQERKLEFAPAGVDFPYMERLYEYIANRKVCNSYHYL